MILGLAIVWLSGFLFAIVGGAFLYVAGPWKPCICAYLHRGESCPRHGEKP